MKIQRSRKEYMRGDVCAHYTQGPLFGDQVTPQVKGRIQSRPVAGQSKYNACASACASARYLTARDLVPTRGRMAVADREKRIQERLAAKVKRREELAALRAQAGSRLRVDIKRMEKRQRDAEAQRMQEALELKTMREEEHAQRSAGDRQDLRSRRQRFAVEREACRAVSCIENTRP